MEAKFLTIFNLVAGLCSILGYLYVQFRRSTKYNLLIKICLLTFFACTVYVLLVPANFFQKNLEEKLLYYSTESNYDPDNVVLREQGSFNFNCYGEKTVVFDLPYKKTPEFYVTKAVSGTKGININNVCSEYAVVSCDVSGSTDKFLWFARGEPLYPMEGEIKVKVPK